MNLSSKRIRKLICEQCNVPNPFNLYVLDREKTLPATKDVVDFIINGVPKFHDYQECEDRALQTIATCNRIAPEWCHGMVTIKRIKQKDIHTVCVFIDNKEIVQLYDPSNAKYINYPFEVQLVVIF